MGKMPSKKTSKSRSGWLPATVFAVACLAVAWPAQAEPVPTGADLLERPAKMSGHAARAVLLAVTRAGQRLVAVGEQGIVLLSDDHGVSWRQARVPTSVALTNVRFVSASLGWAVGHGGVIVHSSDAGETWVKQLDGKQLARIELEAAQAEAGAGGSAAQRRLADAQRWVADGADKPLFDIHFSDADSGLVVGAYGLILATRDGGQTWQSLRHLLDNPKGKHFYSIAANGAERYIAGEQGALYRSTDGGRGFAELKTPYGGSYFGVLRGAAGELLVFGLRGNAYRSGDDGASWQRVDTELPVTLTAGAQRSDGTLLLTDETGRLLHSLDGGRHFSALPVARPSPFTGIVQAVDGGLVLTSARGMSRLAAGSSSTSPTNATNATEPKQ